MGQELAGSVLCPTAISVTSGAAVQLSDREVRMCVEVCAPIANTAAVYIGDSGVTSAKGLELQPGYSRRFFVKNSNILYAIAASGTQSIQLLVQ